MLKICTAVILMCPELRHVIFLLLQTKCQKKTNVIGLENMLHVRLQEYRLPHNEICFDKLWAKLFLATWLCLCGVFWGIYYLLCEDQSARFLFSERPSPIINWSLPYISPPCHVWGDGAGIYSKHMHALQGKKCPSMNQCNVKTDEVILIGHQLGHQVHIWGH